MDRSEEVSVVGNGALSVLRVLDVDVVCVVCLSFLLDCSGVGYFYVNLGVSQALVLSTSTNLLSDLIGTRTGEGAFVFGVYSMLDKAAVGLAIYFVGRTQAYNKGIGMASQED